MMEKLCGQWSKRQQGETERGFRNGQRGTTAKTGKYSTRSKVTTRLSEQPPIDPGEPVPNL